VLLPFVNGVADVELVQGLLEEARRELEKEGLPCAEDLPLGVTLEVPAAALQAETLARRVRFLTIGTNDLVQYLLAVDRSDPRVAHLYEPLHPTVLRVVADVLASGRRCGVPVAVCGEMAADPLAALALVGLGARELSMAPAAIPRVKAALRAVEVGELERGLQVCLTLATAAEVEAALRLACQAAVPAAAP
jgi:phosphotransferase system enzyme I (PtsI)